MPTLPDYLTATGPDEPLTRLMQIETDDRDVFSFVGIENAEGDEVALVYVDDGAPDGEADARRLAMLLSSAPDLLAALENCLDSLLYVAKVAPDLSGYAVREERMAQARAAITRARSSA
jgi:hypothetical protein